jgi:hypothetical protein
VYICINRLLCVDLRKVSVFVILETRYLYSKCSLIFFVQVWRDVLEINVSEKCPYMRSEMIF